MLENTGLLSKWHSSVGNNSVEVRSGFRVLCHARLLQLPSLSGKTFLQSFHEASCGNRIEHLSNTLPDIQLAVKHALTLWSTLVFAALGVYAYRLSSELGLKFWFVYRGACLLAAELPGVNVRPFDISTTDNKSSRQDRRQSNLFLKSSLWKLLIDSLNYSTLHCALNPCGYDVSENHTTDQDTFAELPSCRVFMSCISSRLSKLKWMIQALLYV